MKKRDLTTVTDFSREEILEIFETAIEMKKNPEKFKNALKGKVLGMVFEKPSTRTRVSFEVGIYQLGGTGLFLSKNDLQLGRGETIKDTAKVLSRYLNAIMARTFSHDTIVELAENATIPVINGLSNLFHPCQALADFLTILEHKGGFENIKVSYVGDGNNVLHSLILTAAILGVKLHYATPEGYEPKDFVVEKAKSIATSKGFELVGYHDPQKAVKDADVIYTDVWTSMGDEAEKETRDKIFRPFQVNTELVKHAKDDFIFMHCLPAHRGEEVTDEVIDSKNSVVFDEAENRLHVQKAIMYFLMAF